MLFVAPFHQPSQILGSQSVSFVMILSLNTSPSLVFDDYILSPPILVLKFTEIGVENVALFGFCSEVDQRWVKSSQYGCHNYIDWRQKCGLFAFLLCLFGFCSCCFFSALCGWPAVGSKGFHAVVQRKGAASFKLLKSIEQSSSR